MTATPLALAELDAVLENAIVGAPMPKGRRLLGLEYEQLILERGTGRTAPVEVTVRMMRELVETLDADPIVEGELVKGLRTERFELSMEPGGQIELASPPHPRLALIDRAFEAASTELENWLASAGIGRVLG